MSKKILVAIDNSDYAEKVMLQAIELAQFFGTPLQVISVIETAYLTQTGETDPVELETTSYWKVSFQNVVEKCQKLAEINNVGFCSIRKQGNPAEEIIKFAQQHGIDLIVLGHLGKSAPAGFQIGSVAQNVAAHAKCSVLIVK